MFGKILLAVVLLLVAVQLLLTLLSWRVPPLGLVPSGNGSQARRLRPCPGTPNCVCSQDAEGASAITPLRFSGDPPEAFERLRRLCIEQLGCRLVESKERYMRFACITPLMRYVDDLEFLLDEETGVIHVRSASRVGRSDLGVNRRRVEQVRELFGH